MSSSFAEAGRSAVISIAPIILPSPGRGVDLHVRVSAPVVGEALPVLIFSHGNGQSLHGYGPLADYWAAHGFVVIQPTHLNSRTLGLSPDDPRRPHLWRFREEDLLAVLDGLDRVEGEAPMIRGRLDRSRIAVAGHSWGGQTPSTLLGATHPDPDSTMTAPTLILVGDHDMGRLSTRGSDWWRDAYDLSPSPKALFTAFGGEHALGGIPGYEARETTDERPQRVTAIQRLSTAFLRSALYPGDSTWTEAVATLTADAAPEGRIETK